MFKIFEKKAKDNNVYAPVNGKCISLDEVKDKVFANRLMGEGIAFQFQEETIYSPIDGSIIMIANTKHAIGIKGDNGAEWLLHVGLDTVNLNGQGLEVLVSMQQKVTKGTPILTVDQTFMIEHNIDLTTPLILTNGKDFTLSFEHEFGNVDMGDKVMKVDRG